MKLPSTFLFTSLAASAVLVAAPSPSHAAPAVDCGQALFPTLEQCQSAAFRAQCQQAPQCPRVLGNAFGEYHDGLDLDLTSSPDEFPEEAGEAGIDNPRPRVPPPPDYSNYESIRSWENAVYAAGSGPFIDALQRSRWANNGLAIGECVEYAYEKYYDVSYFQDRASELHADYRGVYDTAFGPAANRASFGTRHVNDNRIMNRTASASYASMPAPGEWWKNAYYGLGDYANVLALYEGAGDDIVPALTPGVIAKIRGIRHINVPTMAWHRDKSNQMAAVPRFQPLRLPDGVLDRFGYLDSEVDEFDVKQKRLDAAVARLAGALVALRSADITRTVLENQDVRSDAGFVRSMEFQIWSVSPALWRNNPAATRRARIELAEIITLLNEANSAGCLRTNALTVCDWSPRRFTRDFFAMANRVTALAANDYAKCIKYVAVPGNFTPLLNPAGANGPASFRTPAFCSTGQGRGLTCVDANNPATCRPADAHNTPAECGAPFTWHQTPQFNDYAGNDYRTSPPRVDRYLANMAAYRPATADFRFEAMRSSLRGIHEMVNPLTGALQLPSFSKQMRDTLGDSDYASVSYDFGLSWNVGGLQPAVADVCDLHAGAEAHARVDVSLAGNSRSFLDAQVMAKYRGFRAENGTIYDGHLHLKVLDQNIFNPQNRTATAETAQTLAFNVATAGESSVERSAEHSFNFSVGPIPMRVTIGAAGRLGFRGSFAARFSGVDAAIACSASNVNAYVRGTVEPFAGLDAFVEAAVDAGIASAGVRGELTLIDVSLPYTVDMKLKLLPNLPQTPGNVALSVTNTPELRVETLSGKLSAFARVDLGIWEKTIKKTILSWEGPVYELKYPSSWSVKAQAIADLF